MPQLNLWLDRIPRTAFGFANHEWHAWRAAGVTGFYAALVVLFGDGLVAGVSLLVLAALTATCAGSFFAYAYLRRKLTGRENLVLLEHVWVALCASALVLYLLREPILRFLDVLAPALCVFLAAGRIGCLMVGCCHGNPSSTGICYGDDAVREGFPVYLAGVRLFPVQAVESVGLLFIAICGLAAPRNAPAGAVLCWFLIAYGVLRFALEGMRGDDRATCLGLSQARWMILIQIAACIELSEARAGRIYAHLTLSAVLLGAGLILIAVLRLRDPRRRLLATEHIGEVSSGFSSGMRPEATPAVLRSRRGVTVAISSAGTGSDDFAHVSVSLRNGVRDLKLLCEVVALSFPELRSTSARYSARNVLHFLVPLPRSGAERVSASELYGRLARTLQAGGGPDSNAGAETGRYGKHTEETKLPSPASIDRAMCWYFPATRGGGRHE